MFNYSTISSVSALIEVTGYEDRSREVQWIVKEARNNDFWQEAFQLQKGNLRKFYYLFAYQTNSKIPYQVVNFEVSVKCNCIIGVRK